VDETQNRGITISPEALTDQRQNAKARRRSRYLGVDEARVEFLEAVQECVPQVFQDLAGEPFARYQVWVRLQSEDIPEAEPAGEWTARLKAAQRALEAAIGQWQADWNLSADWCGEKAHELLEASLCPAEVRVEGVLFKVPVPPGRVDLERDVSPREALIPVCLDPDPTSESEAEPMERMTRDVVRAARQWAKTTRLELRGATWQEQRRHFARAARWQCGGDRYDAIAEAAGVKIETVKEAVPLLLDFIGLEHAHHRRGPHR
jgi:hypothetical protein